MLSFGDIGERKGTEKDELAVWVGGLKRREARKDRRSKVGVKEVFGKGRLLKKQTKKEPGSEGGYV